MLATRAKMQLQKDQLVALNFRVPLNVRRRLKLLAAEKGVTMTTLLMSAIEDAEKQSQCIKIDSNL